MKLTIEGGVGSIAPQAWDALVSCSSPFVSHAFLKALEDSASVGPGTGWTPFTLLVHENGTLVGAAPAYVKAHSYGEYIFDWGWAEAAQRSGIPYYPKLVVMPPFTPATGQRLLCRSSGGDGRLRAVRDALARGAIALAQELGLSSVHWLFLQDEDCGLLVDNGYCKRTTHQYHWRDQGFGNWEGFLESLRSKRRREIRREQRRLAQAGIQVEMLRGEEMSEEHWAALDRFYRSTTQRKWGTAYLQPDFFVEARSQLAGLVRMAAAVREGRLIAGALFFEGPGGLYGRYWGCDEHHPFLHFETAYHAGIRWCLEQGISRFEAGAQGEHKLARGFLPTPIYSAHWLAHPGLFAAVRRFLNEECQATESWLAGLRGEGPYREGG